MKKKWILIGSVLFCALMMTLMDTFLELTYGLRSLLKIIMFMIIPMMYFLMFREDIPKIKQLFQPKKKDFLMALGLGIAVYMIILTAYIIFKDFIDLTTIKNALLENVGVSAENFLIVALYISFVNSLLEEFFFRGYAFILLKNEVKPVTAYLLSAFLFAFYHVGMTLTWFHPVIYVLAMTGLVAGGLIFNALNDRCGQLYPSWLVHMCANFAINTIGCILFGIL